MEARGGWDVYIDQKKTKTNDKVANILAVDSLVKYVVGEEGGISYSFLLICDSFNIPNIFLNAFAFSINLCLVLDNL